MRAKAGATAGSPRRWTLASPLSTVRCVRCKTKIKIKGRGRVPKFCSPTCRQLTYEQRKWQRPTPVVFWLRTLLRSEFASFAKAHGYTIAAEFYDAAVSGADPVDQRPGFKDMLALIAGNGVRVILVESPDRFARDITVQEVGHRMLKAPGVCLIPTTAPDHFTTDTPTSKMILRWQC
jgi:hypothetical protein